jgi:hypothetical protein
MIDIAPPELSPHPITLHLVDEPTRGRDDDPAVTIERRVLIGGPLSVPLTADSLSADPELCAFIEHEAAHWTYHLVHLAVTFESGRHDPPFESALVEVVLSTGETAQPAVAYQMVPLRLTGQPGGTTNWRLGPRLRLQDVELELGAVDHKGTSAPGEVSTEALRLLRPDPAWRIKATPDQPIDGTHRFAMVVRSPNRAKTTTTISVQAYVRERKLLHYNSRPLQPVLLAGPL